MKFKYQLYNSLCNYEMTFIQYTYIYTHTHTYIYIHESDIFLYCQNEHFRQKE